jgi:enoyl-[acyl-carrier protein] reductase I
MSLVKGKKGLIMGVANERSIAWGISQKLAEAGAELAFTYLGDALKKKSNSISQIFKFRFYIKL